MKLRIQGDSLRLRITPSEMSRLLQEGRVSETVHFGAGAELSYSLEHHRQDGGVSVDFRGGNLFVRVPRPMIEQWAGGSDVGIYVTQSLGQVTLAIAIEKDFACLDKSDAENRDTYPNPNLGAVC